MLVDLHMHSTCSDGILDAASTVKWALEQGASIVSLTDHDSVEGIRDGMGAVKNWNSSKYSLGPNSVAFITGIELSCMYEGRLTHLLGYGFDAAFAPLTSLLERIASLRLKRARQIMELVNAMGIPLTYEEAFGEDAPTLIGRSHIARAIVAHGYMDTVDKVFNSFIGDDCGAFVPVDEISIEEGIAMLHEAGGLAVLAHPRGISHAQYEALGEMGLDGIECFHPRVQQWQRDCIMRSADSLGLFLTGGSDFHGPPADGSPYFPACPDIADPETWIGPILALAGVVSLPSHSPGGLGNRSDAL